MKKILVLILIINCNLSFSQSFKVHISPQHDTLVPGNNLTFNVTAEAINGFGASIYLTVTNTACLNQSISITPSALNSPYNNGQINLTNTAALVPGDYVIIIQGKNGSVNASDTCYLNVKNSPSNTWTTYNTNNLRLSNNSIWSITPDSSGLWMTGFYDYAGGEGCVAYYNYTNWEIWTTKKHHYVVDNCNNLISSDNNSLLFGNGETGQIYVDKKNIKWIGSPDKGLIRFDGKKSWRKFDTVNSSMPSNNVVAITTDLIGNKWISTANGLVKYNDTTFTTYNTSNSSIPSNNVKYVVVDKDQKLWIGTDAGLSIFDGTFWTTYNTANSNIYGNLIITIVIDKNNVKWLSAGGYLQSFDGTTWSTYLSPNNNVIDEYIRNIVIDNNNNKWITCQVPAGLVKFDGNFTYYSSPNYPVPPDIDAPQGQGQSNIVLSVNLDKNNNPVIGVLGGGFTLTNGNFLPSGATSLNEINKPLSLNVFPNPSDGLININGVNSPSIISLYNILGEKVFERNINEDLSINTKDYALLPGIYFLSIKSEKSSYTSKLIITSN